MKLPASLTRKIGGVPAWAWALTLALFLAYVVWKRRQGQQSEEELEPTAEGLSPTAELSGLGGYVGGGTEEGGFAFFDALDALADLMGRNTATIVDRVDESQTAIEERIDTSGEQIAALITDGYNPEPGPGMPGSPPPVGGDNGNGNGQLPPDATAPAPTAPTPSPAPLTLANVFNPATYSGSAPLSTVINAPTSGPGSASGYAPSQQMVTIKLEGGGVYVGPAKGAAKAIRQAGRVPA